MVFLVAPSGIGKSALAARLIATNPDVPALRVRVPGGQERIAETGYYLRLIAKALHRSARPTNAWDSFSEFSKQLTPSVWKALMQAVAADFGASLKAPRTTTVFATRGLGLGEFDVDRVFQTAATEVLGAFETYMVAVLRQFPILLNIENIQLIDDFTLDLLAEAVLGGSHYLLLEYTEGEAGRELRHLRDYFESEACEVTVRALARLPARYATKLLRHQPGALESFFANTYARSDGNLRPLADLEVQMEVDPSVFEEYATGTKPLSVAPHDNISSLSRDDQFLLVVIAVNDASVHADDLRSLHALAPGHVSGLDLENGLARLAARRLIERSDDTVRITHDQIIEIANTGPALSKYRVIAFEFWKRFYARVLDEGSFFIPRSEALLQSLVFSYRTNDHGHLFALLDEVAVQALRTRAPDRLLFYITELKAKLLTASQTGSGRITTALRLKLLQVSYEIGQFQFAFGLLPDQLATPIEILYRAALLDLTDKQEAAIAYCDQQLTSGSFEPPVVLMLQLVKLSALRGSNQHAPCRELFERLIGITDFRRVTAYGFLLRAAELALTPLEAEAHITQSVRFFERLGDGKATAYARIALSLTLGDVGRLDDAEWHLRRALDELAGKVAETHTILNNLAAVRLYRRQFDRETLETLQYARATASDPFERLVIAINSMIALTESGALEAAASLAGELHDMLGTGAPREKEIRRIAFFNLAYHCRARGDGILARAYMNQARSIDLDHNQDLWRFRFQGVPVTDPNFTFRAQFDYYPAFLSYWHPTIAMGVLPDEATPAEPARS